MSVGCLPLQVSPSPIVVSQFPFYCSPPSFFGSSSLPSSIRGPSESNSWKCCWWHAQHMPNLLYIYSALIQPHFDYCNLVWGNCGKTLSDRLQKLQNRAARLLTSSSYDADAKGLCTQRQIQKALMVYRSLNGLVPEYLSSKFLKRNGTRYSLRDSEKKLVAPLPRTNNLKNSFSYNGAALWNSLPCNLRMIKSLNQFKKQILL